MEDPATLFLPSPSFDQLRPSKKVKEGKKKVELPPKRGRGQEESLSYLIKELLSTTQGGDREKKEVSLGVVVVVKRKVGSHVIDKKGAISEEEANNIALLPLFLRIFPHPPAVAVAANPLPTPPPHSTHFHTYVRTSRVH